MNADNTTPGKETRQETKAAAEEKRGEAMLEAELNKEIKADGGAPSQAGNIVVSLIMAIIGLVFIWLCDRRVVSSTVLFIGALAFIIPGAALLLSLLVNRRKKSRGSVMSFMTAICGLAAVALGIVILVVPESFRHLLLYLFGGLMIVASAWQFDVMMRKNRGILYPSWLVIAPVIVVALGVVMCTLDFFRDETNEKWVLLASGCGFTLFGIIGLFISYYAMKSAHAARKLVKEAAKATSAAVSVSGVKSAKVEEEVKEVEEHSADAAHSPADSPSE